MLNIAYVNHFGEAVTTMLPTLLSDPVCDPSRARLMTVSDSSDPLPSRSAWSSLSDKVASVK